MTKQHPDETALNYPIGIDETNKPSGNISKILENHPIIICNSTADNRGKNMRRLDRHLTADLSKKIELEGVMSRLKNLESSPESAKTIKVDLDLYQMEKL